MRQELQAKGLEAHTIQDALKPARETELARAHAIWLKKFGQAPHDASARAKQMRFLAGRGFGGDTIHRVVGGGCHGYEGDDGNEGDE
jgi:regulatory protein